MPADPVEQAAHGGQGTQPAASPARREEGKKQQVGQGGQYHFQGAEFLDLAVAYAGVVQLEQPLEEFEVAALHIPAIRDKAAGG